MALVILKQTVTGGGPPLPYYNVERYSWDRDTKSIVGPIATTDSSGTPYSKPVDELVDFYMVSPGIVRRIYHNGAGSITYTDGACDISLALPDKTDETAHMANDGTVTLSGYTTYGTVQYSLDNVFFQYSGNFSGLAPGDYTAYARDTVGCTTSRTFSIVIFNYVAVLGCTNPAATNYDPLANEDDGLCVFPVAPVYSVLESKIIEVRHCIPENPVYLRWKNSLGGFSYWMFGYKQEISKTTSDLGIYELYSPDLENQKVVQKSLGKTSIPSMKLGADGLTTNQKEVIAGILDSPAVDRMFQDGKYYRVTINAGSFLITDTKASTHSIEFDMILPRINTLTN